MCDLAPPLFWLSPHYQRGTKSSRDAAQQPEAQNGPHQEVSSLSANTAEVQKLWSKKVRSQSIRDPRAALCLDWMTRLEWGERLASAGPEAESRLHIPVLMFSVTSPLELPQLCSVQFSSAQSLSPVWLFATPWTPECQASLSITNTWSLLKRMSIELVMPSNQPILCHPLNLLPSIFPSIRVFPNESALCIRWPKCWSFRFSISPSNERSRLISFESDWFDLLAG